jgi:DNA-binding GntR family transcriptional regulator
MLEGIVPARPYRTKEEYIYDALRTAILRCQIAPGEKLVIDQLTGVFGVSAIPIRSALQRLEVEGLVKIVPHAGAEVSEISVDMVAEIFALMEALEGLAFRFASEKVGESDLAELSGLVQRMEQACREGNADRWSDLNGEFHIKVAEITQLELLCRFTRTIFDYWGRLRRYYLTEIVEDILAAQAEHHTMVELLRQRRTQELADLVVPHNRRSRDYFLRVMPPKAS